jgi:hypothetical protein
MLASSYYNFKRYSDLVCLYLFMFIFPISLCTNVKRVNLDDELSSMFLNQRIITNDISSGPSIRYVGNVQT